MSVTFKISLYIDILTYSALNRCFGFLTEVVIQHSQLSFIGSFILLTLVATFSYIYNIVSIYCMFLFVTLSAFGRTSSL